VEALLCFIINFNHYNDSRNKTKQTRKRRTRLPTKTQEPKKRWKSDLQKLISTISTQLYHQKNNHAISKQGTVDNLDIVNTINYRYYLS